MAEVPDCAGNELAYVDTAEQDAWHEADEARRRRAGVLMPEDYWSSTMAVREA